MSRVTKYSDDMLGWKRESGPLRVWRVVDGRKKTADGKTMRFSIQEIPENRQDDVMNLMCPIFIRDEPLCHHLNAIDNPVAIEDFRKLWSLALQKGLVVGAFLVDEDNRKPVLAGVNMTLITCETEIKIADGNQGLTIRAKSGIKFSGWKKQFFYIAQKMYRFGKNTITGDPVISPNINMPNSCWVEKNNG